MTTCLRKNRYPTQGMATKVATRQSKETGEVIQAYACPDCGGWHLGHPRLGPDRGMRRARRGR